MHVNKERVRQRFARAAATYDNQAVIQLQVANRLLALLEEHVTDPPRRVLEIGCCTGLLTERLHRLFTDMTHFYVNDLVPDFQARISERLDNDPRLVYLPGDIEQLEIPANLDLIVSSSTLHWLEDLPALFRKFDQCLVPGGTICFSIYGIGNLPELRKITGIGLDYHSLHEIEGLVKRFFHLLACKDEQVTLQFDAPLALLNHLRETGVNAIDTVPWTRSRLEQFHKEYVSCFESDGKVPLTYHPIYCIARKKP